mgnify:CR=1 FL=1
MLKSWGLFISLLFLPNLLFSQKSKLDVPVNVEYDNRSLEKILVNLEDKTGILLSYNPESVPLSHWISYSAINKPVSMVLSEILNPLDLEYQVVAKQVIIRPKKN